MKIKSEKDEAISLQGNALVIVDQFKDVNAVNLDRFKKPDIQAIIRALQNYHNCREGL